jgi:hypothetical protein
MTNYPQDRADLMTEEEVKLVERLWVEALKANVPNVTVKMVGNCLVVQRKQKKRFHPKTYSLRIWIEDWNHGEGKTHREPAWVHEVSIFAWDLKDVEVAHRDFHGWARSSEEAVRDHWRGLGHGTGNPLYGYWIDGRGT